MSVRDPENRSTGAVQHFRQASEPKARTKRPPPFSLRLSAEERATLDAQAGGQPLGAFIRERLLGAEAQPRRKMRRPCVDEQKLALVLADLGKSRLASNVNQLAKAVNMGTLDVSGHVEQELLDACASIREMRDTLIAALGLRVEAGE